MYKVTLYFGEFGEVMFQAEYKNLAEAKLHAHNMLRQVSQPQCYADIEYKETAYTQ